MDELEVKKALNKEIKKECEAKGVEFSTLTLDENFNLLGSGIFDSLGILQLISKMEVIVGEDIDLSEHSPSEFTNYVKLISMLKKDNEEVEHSSSNNR